ncbi:hypothetical protein AVEN_274433-1 [Araneus ventricosus]|uniref:Uncharacterized protein n=1 Tax=Araneus ventricosus TaxID=182803 RepID=A0A4Y2F6L2_ARAVE|nr:hypothetical protein AVEN_274433-1 [Araneus ventricosus]
MPLCWRRIHSQIIWMTALLSANHMLFNMVLCFKYLRHSTILIYERYVVVVSYSTCSSPQLDQAQENTLGERFMVKEESAASVGTRPWTPEGRSLTLSFAFMLYMGMIEWPSRLG